MRWFAIPLVILWTLLSVAQNNPQVPDTVPGRLFSGWLNAFNSGDAVQMKEFGVHHLVAKPDMSIEDRVERDQRFRQMTGGFDVVRVEESTEKKITVLLREKGGIGGYASLELSVDDQSPDRIASMRIGQVPPPKDLAAGKMTLDELTADVDAQLKKRAAEDEFSGVIEIAKDGKTVWQKAYGPANRETKKPNTMETTFNLGSMNKMFTAVAIGQLVQSGKLQFSDTLAKVMPDYPNQEVARKITIQELLTHTSGLGDIFGPEFDARKDSIHDVKDYLPLFANKPLKFEPGKGSAYSNAGFVVLGLIIEQLTGENYYDYIQKHIYDVAGMKHAGSPPKLQRGPDAAISYTRQNPEKRVEDATALQPYRGLPAADLVAFDQAFRNHRLLNAEMTEQMITPRAEIGPDFATGYGFGIRTGYGHKIVGHNGGSRGVNGELQMYLDNGYTVVVLANCDPPAAERVVEYIRQRMP